MSGVNTQFGTVRNKQTATTASSGIPAHPRLAPTTALYQPVTMTLPSSGSTGACSTSAHDPASHAGSARDESGFTLVELLTAMTIGMLLLFASLMLLDHSTALTKQITDRQDAVQRGRQAMELMVRDLRSQVCLGDETEPITVARDDRVTFYADLSDGTTDVQQRTIRYDAATKSLIEDIHVGTGIVSGPRLPRRPHALPTAARECRAGRGRGRPAPDSAASTHFATAVFPGTSSSSPLRLIPDDAIRTVMVKIALRRASRTAFDRAARTRRCSRAMSTSALPIRPTPSEGPRCI